MTSYARSRTFRAGISDPNKMIWLVVVTPRHSFLGLKELGFGEPVIDK
jgi:hypothetical protein